MSRRVTIRVAHDFAGPTLPELLPILDGRAPGEVRWEGSALDMATLGECTGEVVLVVPNISAMERTARQVGMPYQYPVEALRNGVSMLNPSGDNIEWRKFCSKVGPNSARGLVTKLVAEEARSGAKKNPMTTIVRECWLSGTNPADIDVLVNFR